MDLLIFFLILLIGCGLFFIFDDEFLKGVTVITTGAILVVFLIYVALMPTTPQAIAYSSRQECEQIEHTSCDSIPYSGGAGNNVGNNLMLYMFLSHSYNNPGTYVQYRTPTGSTYYGNVGRGSVSPSVNAARAFTSNPTSMSSGAVSRGGFGATGFAHAGGVGE